MKQIAIALSIVTLFFVACQENSTEKLNSSNSQNAPQYDLGASADFKFELVGTEKESEELGTTFLVNQIQVIKKGSDQVFQALSGFEAEVQKNEQVIVEDLNFDGIPDIRLMQFLPSDASIAYFYWLYDANTGRYVRAKSLEEKVFSPIVDIENQVLVSQWRDKNGSFGSDNYAFVGELDVELVQQEKNEPYQDTLYKKITITYSNNAIVSTQEEVYSPETHSHLLF